MISPISVICEKLDLDSIYVSRAFRGLITLQGICHDLARKSGWWDELATMPEEYKKYYFATKRELIHSELSEALEGARKGKMDDHLPHRKAEEVEMADAIIRILDYAGGRNLDITGALFEKLGYNQTRVDHKREHRAADGGKQF